MNEIDFQFVFGSLRTFECECEPLPWGGGMPGELNAFYGKRHTEESRRLMSESLRGKNLGNKNAGDVKGENNPMYGKYGIDNPNYGKKRSLEFKQQQSKRFSGKNNPMYGKLEFDNPNKKLTIEQTETLISDYKTCQFSLQDLSDKYNISYVTVKRTLRKHVSLEDRNKITNMRRGKK